MSERSEPTALDQEQEPQPRRAPSPSRRKATASKKAPRAPRRAQPAEQSESEDIATLVRQNQELMAKLEQFALGGVHYVETQPEYQPPARVADDEELTEFQRELKTHTFETPHEIVREKSYNYVDKWFSKPDGSIVQLAGDPPACAIWQKLGYHQLTPEQVERYLKVERLEILRRQQTKAALINNIRRVISIDPALKAGLDPKFDQDTDRMTVEELEGVWAELTHTDDGKRRFRLQRPQRLQDADDLAAQRESDRMLAGVDMTPPASRRAAFEDEQNESRRSGGRAIEVTRANANTFA